MGDISLSGVPTRNGGVPRPPLIVPTSNWQPDIDGLTANVSAARRVFSLGETIFNLHRNIPTEMVRKSVFSCLEKGKSGVIRDRVSLNTPYSFSSHIHGQVSALLRYERGSFSSQRCLHLSRHAHPPVIRQCLFPSAIMRQVAVLS